MAIEVKAAWENVLNTGTTTLDMFVNDLIDDPIFLGLLGDHNVIAFDILFNTLERHSGVPDEDIVGDLPHPQDLAGLNIDVGSLSGKPAERGLVDQDASVRQGEPLALRAGGEKQGGHGGCLSDADGADVGADKLHRVVDAHPGRNRSAWRIDVERNIFFRVFGFEEQHLSRDEVGDIVVDRRSDKDNVVFEKPRVDVVGALASAGLFDHHWN